MCLLMMDSRAFDLLRELLDGLCGPCGARGFWISACREDVRSPELNPYPQRLYPCRGPMRSLAYVILA